MIRDQFNRRLCRTIQDYWARRGYVVRVDPVSGPYRCAEGFPIGEIVSDLGPTGFPSRRVHQAGGATLALRAGD
jgi:hypothetical protein